jgi:hypothetical protein
LLHPPRRTSDVVVPGAPQVTFRVGVAIQLQPQGSFQALVTNGTDEFMAIAALLQAPGRLMFDPVAPTL